MIKLKLFVQTKLGSTWKTSQMTFVSPLFMALLLFNI